jgi:hypothetical protein
MMRSLFSFSIIACVFSFFSFGVRADSFESENFSITVDEADSAQILAAWAEHFRKRIYEAWFTEPFHNWEPAQRGSIKVKVKGFDPWPSWSVNFDAGKVAEQSAEIKGPFIRLVREQLPSQITRMVMNTKWGRHPPSWFIEGASVLSADVIDRGVADKWAWLDLDGKTLLPLSKIFAIKDREGDLVKFPAQSYMLLRFLIRKVGKQGVLAFLEKCSKENLTKGLESIGYPNLGKLEEVWLEWLRKKEPATLDDQLWKMEELPGIVATRNFMVFGIDVNAARMVADRFEMFRKIIAMAWSGKIVPDWERDRVAFVRVHLNGTPSHGDTKERAASHRQYVEYEITLEGSWDSSLWNTVIPHECTHLVLRSFVKGNIPSWVDEGIASMSDAEGHRRFLEQLSVQSLSLNRIKALSDHFKLSATDGQVGMEVQEFYAQSLSLVRYLERTFGRPRLLSFLNEATGAETWDWDASFKKLGFAGRDDFEQKWRAWLALNESTPQSELIWVPR